MFDTAYKLTLDKNCSLEFDTLNPDFSLTRRSKEILLLGRYIGTIFCRQHYCISWMGDRRKLSIGTRKWDKRSVTEPETGKLLRGPHRVYTDLARSIPQW
jgi:hypothetical protein